MNKITFARIVFIAFILFDMLVVAISNTIPAYAAFSCSYNPQHGWHIVGGGQQNDHWYDTEEECLAALTTPEPTVTNAPTNTAVPTSTSVPTNTAMPTPTGIPTSTSVPTETALPTITAEPTETANPTSTVAPDGTPRPTNTPIPTLEPKAAKPGHSCAFFWAMIQTRKFRDVGYRHFETHDWCQSWLWIKHGVDYDYYKLLHP